MKNTLKLCYGQGSAAVAINLLTSKFIAVGPGSNGDALPAFIRTTYMSQSGLSGAVLLENTGWLLPCKTYRPQKWEFVSAQEGDFPLVPVDREMVLTEYPVIWDLEMEGTKKITALTGTNAVPPKENNKIIARSEVFTYSAKCGYNQDIECEVLISLNESDDITEISDKYFYAAVGIMKKKIIKDLVVDMPNKAIGPLSLWRTENNLIFGYNQETNLPVYLATKTPLLGYSAGCERQFWMPSNTEYVSCTDGTWLFTIKEECWLSIQHFSQDWTTCLGKEKRIRDISELATFWKDPESWFFSQE